jgi:L-amino acid N-acyltransferase YncA
VSQAAEFDISVREVALTDAEAIVAILNPIIEARMYTAFDTPFSVDDERRYIAGFPARGIWKVAVTQPMERVVGFQVVEPIATYTHAFDHVGTCGTFVDERWRRRGVAARLFQATFDSAVAKGFEKLFTFVRADNERALQTYLKHGFARLGTATRQAKIDGRYVDEIFIERFLA